MHCGRTPIDRRGILRRPLIVSSEERRNTLRDNELRAMSEFAYGGQRNGMCRAHLKED